LVAHDERAEAARIGRAPFLDGRVVRGDEVWRARITTQAWAAAPGVPVCPPLGGDFAIPLMLILTMARAELLQLTVEVVLDRLSPTRNDNDPAVLGDLDPHVLHTRLTSGPDSLGDVGLSECGGRASHCDYREACLSAVMRRSLAKLTKQRPYGA